jgi:hypothetical protein
MADYPKVPVYLFYGNQPDPILKARDAVLAAVLQPETRDENLTEYYPTANTATVKLGDLLDEISGDLATMSFIPDAPKCIVVTNPAELMGSSVGRPPRAPSKKAAAKKKDPAQALERWIEHELPQTGHHLLLLAFEDEADGREVNEKGSLYTAVMKIGFGRKFSDTKAFFRIEDGLLARDASACLSAVRDLWKSGKGDSAVYGAVVRSLRFLMQANIARERQALHDPKAQGELFPADRQRNLFQAAPIVQRKYLAAPIYRTGDLLKAYEGALRVYRALRPHPGDLYVPDPRGLLEQTILILIGSAPPRRGTAR